MIKIGIAEDDLKIATLLKSALEENGFQVTIMADGLSALAIFMEQKFDLLILDVMMPSMNGLQLCKKIRTIDRQIPILILSALGTINDKVTGLEYGADDYLVKPFHLKELSARINSLLRRNNLISKGEENLLIFEDLIINTASMEVKRNGITIDLSAKEYTLLALFMHHPNRLLTRQYIAEQAWDINFDTGTNVIDVYINFLRKKIDKNFSRKLIHTKINMGYILK